MVLKCSGRTCQSLSVFLVKNQCPTSYTLFWAPETMPCTKGVLYTFAMRGQLSPWPAFSTGALSWMEPSLDSACWTSPGFVPNPCWGNQGWVGIPGWLRAGPLVCHTQIPPSHGRGPRKTLCEAPCQQRMLVAGFSPYLCSHWGPQACDMSQPHTQGLSARVPGLGLRAAGRLRHLCFLGGIFVGCCFGV